LVCWKDRPFFHIRFFLHIIVIAFPPARSIPSSSFYDIAAMATKKQKQPSPRKAMSNLRTWHYLLLILIPLAVFGRSAFFGFVMHDDDKMILENTVIEQGFNPSVAFTTDAWFMDARIELYRPWQSITYMIDYAIAKESPAVYHVHNLLVFIAGVVCLFLFLSFYFKPLLAWAGTLLYSVNLLLPHATGWIAARGDLYLMLFGTGFLLLLQHYLRGNTKRHLWIAVPVFFMALLSKESAVALLPVALVMVYAERKKLPTGFEWMWLGINGVVFAVYFAMRSPAIADAGNLSIVAFFHNLRSLPEEFFKMIVPLGFSVMPGYSMIWSLGGTVMLAVLGYLIVRYKPEQKILLTGAAIWLASLLPSMAYEPSFAGVAYDYLDHRSWFPFIGLWLIIMGVIDKAKLTTHKLAPMVFGAVLLLWSGINVWRIGAYQGWEPYYLNAIITNPGSGLANLNYGSMLRDEGKWAEALPFMEKGSALSPDYTDAKVRLAEAYFKLGKYKETIDLANQALAKEPANLTALQFRGSALGASGQTAAAAEDFKTILNADPGNLHGMFNLGVAYKEANQLNLAIETFSKLIVNKPDFPNAFYERGFCYGKMGLFPQARADMEQSIAYQPEHGASYFFRGRTYEALGNGEAACADWKKALELGTMEAEPYIFEKCQQYK
jgi:tetratricopeptide (TPR) repeat protein